MRPNNWRPGRMQSDPARVVALDVLEQVREGAFANIVLPKALRSAHISGRGRGFATNLTYGTLRMLGRWDAILVHCVQGRPFDEIDPLVHDILRLGAHQILDLKVPLHAALNETVNLARNEVGSGASGFVNAVLHRVSERTNAEWDEVIDGEYGEDTIGALAAKTSHPTWVLEAYITAMEAAGRTADDLPMVLAANNEPAQTVLAARTITPEELAEGVERFGFPFRPGTLLDSTIALERGNPGRLDEVRSFEAGVQDEGSQLVGLILAHAPIEGSDEKWLDMCAGPGGKTATLAAASEAQIFANELHPHRLDLVADAVAPFGDRVVLREGDAREIPAEHANFFDRTLVDVPCSNLGSLRRRPEARWTKTDDDAANMTELQASLLEAAIEATRPGGIICYATCSPDVRETREIVERFDVDVIDAVEIAKSIVKPGALDDAVGPYLQLWPDLHDSDAMFAALLRKK